LTDKPHATSTIVARVLPPPHNLRDAAAMEQLIGTLAQLPAPVSLELAGQHGQRTFLVRGTSEVVERVTTALYSVYRQLEVETLPLEDDPLSRCEGERLGAQLAAAGPEYLSLKTWREFEGHEPLDALLGAFDGLGPDEVALSQVIVRGAAPSGWASAHLGRLAALKRRGYGAELPAPASHILGWMLGTALILLSAVCALWAYAGDWQRWLFAGPLLTLAAPLAVWLFTWCDADWSRVLDDEAAAKLRDPAFNVEVRLWACAPTEARTQSLLSRLISAYHLLDTTAGNRFEVAPLHDRSPQNIARPGRIMRLNVKEIAGLWHIPVGESLELIRRQGFERLLPAPGSVDDRTGAFIGVSLKGAQRVPAWLSSEALRRNVFIIGKTQHGKSSLMEHIAAHWMADRGRAVLVVDPHGDLAQRVIGLAPAERVRDVIALDLADEARSAGLNLLDVSDGADPDVVAEGFVDVGRALWEAYWGPRMLIPLGMGLRALAQANLRRSPGDQFTILSLSDLLTANAVTRRAFLDAEVSEGHRPDVRRYFDGEYSSTSAHQLEQIISPVLSKCHAFERSAVIRRLVGQPHSTVSLYAAIRSRKIIVLNTNAGLLGDDLAGFLGSLLLNVMRRVIMRQTGVPREQRVQVSVIADEFQTLTGVDFGALLGELQKNGGNFVLGTQSLDSLRRGENHDPFVARLLAGVDTKVVLQVNGEDAHYLVEHELDVARLRPESVLNLPRYHAYVKTIDALGRPAPVYSVRLPAPLSPDPRVIEAVMAQRVAYALPADEADRQAHLSLLRLRNEYGRAASSVRSQAQTEETLNLPPNSSDVVTQAARLVGHAPSASALQRELGQTAGEAGRVRAQPPAWTQRPATARDESALAEAARALMKHDQERAPDASTAAD
jgi:hypothetical protein